MLTYVSKLSPYGTKLAVIPHTFKFVMTNAANDQNAATIYDDQFYASLQSN